MSEYFVESEAGIRVSHQQPAAEVSSCIQSSPVLLIEQQLRLHHHRLQCRRVVVICVGAGSETHNPDRHKLDGKARVERVLTEREDAGQRGIQNDAAAPAVDRSAVRLERQHLRRHVHRCPTF